MSNIELFKNWLRKQNNQQHFARDIKDGKMVYLSDELAAPYDIMITGLQDDRASIVIEFESDRRREDYVKIAGTMWITQAGWEMWYVGKDFQWLIITDEAGQTKYLPHEVIRSKRITFQFKLEDLGYSKNPGTEPGGQPSNHTTTEPIHMNKKELSELTDQELLEEAKKVKPGSTLNAVFIGVLIGIVVYSVVKNSLGLFTLIPLFFIYQLLKGSKRNKELERLLKERNLK